jgi:hypothetical protein
MSTQKKCDGNIYTEYPKKINRITHEAKKDTTQ